MNDPQDYYDADSNTYAFGRWCEDHDIDPLDIFSGASTPAHDAAVLMNRHNNLEAAWQLRQPRPETETRPRPFTSLLLVLALLAGMITPFVGAVLVAAL